MTAKLDSDLAIVRVWPFGGGGNLALVESYSNFTKLRGVRFFESSPIQTDWSFTQGGRIQVQAIVSTRIRFGATCWGRIESPGRILDNAAVIDVAELGNPYSQQLTVLATKKHKPVIISCIETLGPNPLHKWPPWAGYSRQVQNKASFFRVCTRRSRDALIATGIPDNKIKLIPLGINTERFRPGSFVRDRDDVTFLFSRRLERKNGVGELLTAFQKFHRRHPKAKLLIAGKGPLENLVRAASRSVPLTYLGAVPYAHLPEVYRQADVYCNPARDTYVLGKCVQEDGQYTFPILESQASGLMVISTRSGANSELLSHSNLLIPQCDIAALEAAMEVTMDRELRRIAAEKNRSFILEKFDAATNQILMDRLVRDTGRLDDNS